MAWTSLLSVPQHKTAKWGRRAVSVAGLLAASCLGLTQVGCDSTSSWPEDGADYLNLRKSFLDPSQVGDFSKKGGPLKPWPILDSLDVIDAPSDRWANATEPTTADILADKSEYTISAGDTIRVSIFDLIQPGGEYIKDATVSEDGNVSIQNIGVVKVLGLNTRQIEEKFAQIAIERNVLPAPGNGNLGPQVAVTLLGSRSRVFSLIGSISRPGTYNVLTNDFRLLDALALAGDIPVQPGMDYLYVIRQVPFSEKTIDPATPVKPITPVTPTKPGNGGSNPLDVLEGIERGTTKPSTAPSSAVPTLVRPLPTAAVVNDGSSVQLAQADLDAALGTPGAKPAAAATTPTTSAAPETTTKPGDPLLTDAISGGTKTTTGQYVYIDGKWVLVNATQPAPGTTGGTGVATLPPDAIQTVPGTEPTAKNPADPFASTQPTDLRQQRVIRIPINALREGQARYNIIVRPGDIINVPSVEPGEFYMMGQISRPGVYTLTGRRITLKMAVASGGGLSGLAIPWKCELIRRIGPNQEVTVQVNLKKIFEGEHPDIFLKPNDILNVGTDPIAPFLAVTRNAYRASYGWGFVYDRNYGDPDQNR